LTTSTASHDPGDETTIDVSLDPLTAISHDDGTTVAATPFGLRITTRPHSSWKNEIYSWRFNLPPHQHLVLVPNGAIAVVSDPDPGPDPDVDDDYSDADAIYQEDLSDEQVADDANDGADGFADEERPDEDGDAPVDLAAESSDDDEATTPLGALDIAADLLDDAVDAVGTRPVVRLANGRVTAGIFSVSGTVATLRVPHDHPYTAHAASVDVDLVAQSLPPSDESVSVSVAPLLLAAAAPPTIDCSGKPRPKIVTYNPQGSEQLIDAIKQNPVPCADYFVEIAAPPANKTDPPEVKWAKKRQVRPQGVQQVCAANKDQRLRDAGAVVYPVAEFHWGAWRDYAQRLGFSSIEAAWRKAGREFRAHMRAAGYGPDASGNPQLCAATHEPVVENWAINEMPSTLTVRAYDKTAQRWVEPSEVRRNARAALFGLYYGYDGASETTYRNVPGTVFVIDPGHARMYFKAYRDGLETLLVQRGFWRPLAAYVKFWGQETYVNPYKSMLLKPGGSTPYPRGTRAQHINAYALHPALLANKSASAAYARSFFRSRYFPLLNGFWGKAAKGYSGYGQTGEIDAPTMAGLVSLQVYSIRRHATGFDDAGAETSSAETRLPHLRIGVAWHGTAPDNPLNSENETIATRIAEALQRAYSPAGTALDACAGGDGQPFCARSVPQDRCAPPPTRTLFNQCWLKNFVSFPWDHAGVDCVLRKCE
jgi:hypothetical protein